MAITKKQSTIMWGLTALLSALFVYAGAIKLIGTTHVVEEFAHLGLPAWFRLVIGVIELAGGVGMLIRSVAAEAASFLIIIMLGAAITVGISGEAPLLQLGVAFLLGGVTYLRAEE